MFEPPNSTGDTNDFEFEALNEARNYRAALVKEFGEHLMGNVLEVGAGVGQMTNHLVGLPGVQRALAVEPDPTYCRRHRAGFPHHEVIEGTVANVPPGTSWDAIVSINVLEHIRNDTGELEHYAQLLSERHGTLCLFVPARPEIYSPIDKDFGHFRRYTRAELRRKLQGAGFEVFRLNYFNLIGYFAWWVNFCLLKKRKFEPAKVRLFDRWIFPGFHVLESKFVRPPFGQSLIVAARSTKL